MNLFSRFVSWVFDASDTNKDARMGSFVVVLADDKDQMETALKELAEKQ